jgi:GNAT superfamily N-acetyltransferase
MRNSTLRTTPIDNFCLRQATSSDVGTILLFIQHLAEYEKLSHEVEATEEKLHETLFGKNPCAEVVLAELEGEPVGFMLFFSNYSTFLAKPGIYLEDLFVLPEHRGKGYGKILLSYLAEIAVERGCGRLEWAVLDWNEPSIQFYKSLGAVPMDEWTTFRCTGEALERLSHHCQQ